MTDVLFQLAADAGEREWGDVARAVWPDGERPIVTTSTDRWFLFDVAWLYRIGIAPEGLV